MKNCDLPYTYGGVPFIVISSIHVLLEKNACGQVTGIPSIMMKAVAKKG